MSEPKTKSGPGYYIFAGVVILVLGIILNDGSTASGALIALGGLVLAFGVLAKAVQLGMQASKRRL